MKANKKNILLIEDDPTLGYLLTEYLKMNDFEISWAKSGEECLKMLHLSSYDLAILDVMLPDINGFDLANKIKNINPQLPFLFLTARSLKIDVLKGFSAGAIDYLKKPIDEEELVVRIKSRLSQLEVSTQKTNTDAVYTIGNYVLDALKQELFFKSEKITLTNRETQVLVYLLNHKNSLCTHKDILTNLWGKNDYFNKKSLNVFITHLRKYLKNDPSIKIDNIHNQGFVLRIDN